MYFLKFISIFVFGVITTASSSDVNYGCLSKSQLKAPNFGSKYTTIEKFPAVVSLERYYQNHDWYHQNCGGAIVSSTYVITSASCFLSSNVLDIDAHLYSIRAGSSYSKKSGTIHRVQKIIIHPEYKNTTQGHDIALLRLEDPLDLDYKTKQDIDMFEFGEKFGNQSTLLTVGWGSVKWKGSYGSAEQIQSIEMKLVDWDRCARIYKNPMCKFYRRRLSSGKKAPCLQYQLQEGEICAAVAGEEALNSNHGDYGGPVFVDGRLAGVISRWGPGEFFDDFKKWPNVITPVSLYREWIEKTINRY